MKKTVVITGASGGIGSEIARLFYKHNYNVVINYNKSEESALKLSEELGGSIAVRADISKESDAQMLIDKAISSFGRVDVLINNAGVSIPKLLFDVTQKDIDDIFDANVKGIIFTTKFASRDMLKYHNGKIINISSMWGICGASCESVYSASKGAVIAFTKAMAKELGPSNINVNCIAPGFIETQMNASVSTEDARAFADDTPLCRLGKTIDIANTALFLASDDASFITGQVISVDGGIVI